MQISNTFAITSLKKEELFPPYKRVDVTDPFFDKILSVSGRHQRSIDISRCFRLSIAYIQRLQICHGLRNLDISYTSIKDITGISTSCQVLQSLFLCGLQLDSYKPISNLTSLQMLNLNYSTINDITPISNLIRLRSLDLGHTLITTISSLHSCTRLEELLLDSTAIQNQDDVNTTCNTLKQLHTLKYLNVGFTILESTRDRVEEMLNNEIYLNYKPREVQWFEAIIINDFKTVKDLILQGQDVEIRAGSWASRLLMECWRGPRCRTETPFFDCNHEESQLRPQGIHLALLLNCREVIVEIFLAKPLLESIVWFGPVHSERFTLVRNTIRSNANSSNNNSSSNHSSSSYTGGDQLSTFTIPEFIKDLFDKRVHAVVFNLRERNPGDWLSQCSNIMKNLQAMHRDPDGFDLSVPDPNVTGAASFVSMSRKSSNKSMSSSAVSKRDTPTAVPGRFTSKSGSQRILDIVGEEDELEEDDDSVSVVSGLTSIQEGNEASASPERKTTTSSGRKKSLPLIAELASYEKSRLALKKHPMVAKLSTKIVLPQREAPPIQIMMSRSESKTPLQMPLVMANRNRSFNQSNTSIKSIAAIPINLLKGDRYYLGPKSYWLESKGPALREKAELSIRKALLESIRTFGDNSGEKYSDSEDEHEQLKEYDSDDPFNQETTIEGKKEMFIELVQKKSDMRKGGGNRNSGTRRRKSRSARQSLRVHL